MTSNVQSPEFGVCVFGGLCRKELPTLYLRRLIKREEMVAKWSTENPGTLKWFHTSKGS